VNKWPLQGGSAGTVVPFNEWAPQIAKATVSFTRYEQARPPSSGTPYRGRGRGTRNTHAATRTLPILMDLATAPPTPRPQKVASSDVRLLSSSFPRTSRPFALPSVNTTYNSPLHPNHQARSSPSLPAATWPRRPSPTHRAATAPSAAPLYTDTQQQPQEQHHQETTNEFATIDRSQQPQQPQEQHHQETTSEPATMNRSQPLLKNDGWWRNSEVLATIGPNLSDKVQLKDIYNALKRYGTIDKIDILLDSNEYRTGRAQVKFSTVTSAFWESGTIDCGGYGRVHVTVRPSFNRPVASHVNPSKLFPEKMVSSFDPL
jgi:hypothetical protein